MKTILFSILALFSFFNLIACSDHSTAVKDYQATFVSISENGDLDDVEQRITNAFNQSFMQQNASVLETVIADLKKMESNIWTDYWLAFAQFRKAIFHIAQNDKLSSEVEIAAALATIEEVNEKTSEHYALQAMIRSFSIQFMQGMKAGIASQKASSELKKAIKLDEKNLRAYYAKGSQDFYTPEQYGGGKEVEEYLTQAIGLENQYNDNPILPTWGKDEAYDLLLQFYIKKEEYEKAKTLFQEAIAVYPNNYQLTQLGAKLVGK